MPCTWDDLLGANFWGRIQLQRRFHRPGTLESFESVWLVLSNSELFSSPELNGQGLASTLPNEFEITHLLETHNQLTLEVEQLAPVASDEPGQPFQPNRLLGEVWLEIRLREANA